MKNTTWWKWMQQEMQWRNIAFDFMWFKLMAMIFRNDQRQWRKWLHLDNSFLHHHQLYQFFFHFLAVKIHWFYSFDDNGTISNLFGSCHRKHCAQNRFLFECESFARMMCRNFLYSTTTTIKICFSFNSLLYYIVWL